MAMVPRSEALETLRWLIEAGADETIVETPVNRFVQRSKSPSPAESASAVPERSGATARRTQGEASPRATPPSVSRAPAASPLSQAESRNATAEAVSLSTLPGAARALAASCQTLAELKAALESFDRLEIKRAAKNTVFADGNPLGRIMLIGEAPGRDEDEKGLPFVGRAGKLLDLMLGSIRLDRNKVYITNVLNWRPPQNREPSPEEAAACLPFLHRHIELADPQVMILLGAVSVRHVLGLTEGIARLRGRWETCQSAALGRSIPVMPTLHPAYLLRQPVAKRLAWRDLCAIAEKIAALGLA